jgi:4-amino-4-deoxy-L-arabinose transferase-like glycosyltransferase
MIKNEKIDLAILLLVSIVLSIYLFFRTYIISTDGALQYIPMAKVFASGFFKDAVRFSGQQPLYSFLIALVSRSVSDFELAGKLISSFFGIMVIFPVYFLGRQIFDRKVAFLSAFFLAIHPYIRRFSGDVLKESTYLFLLATAIWFTLRTLQREKIYPYLFVPLFSAIAYLVRPDGIEVLLVVFFYILFIKKFNPPEKRGVVILLLLFSSVILFLPYLFHLKGLTGEWALSKAKSIGGLLGWGGMRVELSYTSKIIYSLKKLNLQILAIYHPLYLFFLAIGLFKRVSSHFKNEEKFLISFFVLHYLVLFLMILNLTDWKSAERVPEYLLSGRHALPLLLISIYWVGEGFLVVYQWIYKKVESHPLLNRLDSKRKSTLVLVTLSILILAIVLPKTLKPQRYERMTEKWAGIWIKNQSGQGTMIFTTIPRVAYYADGNCEYIDFKKDKWDKVSASMVEKGASYLVISQRDTIDFPNETGSIKNSFNEVLRYEKKGMERIIVYKRVQ